jgi:AcrR family transcriptional regulator
MPRPAKTRALPRKKPKQERSRETVEVILEAAARVLGREGYAGANTNLIAAEAGISVGSLYQYFPGKDALLVELLRRHRERMLALLVGHLEGLAAGDPKETIPALVRAMLDAQGIDPALHRLMIEQVLRRDARAAVDDFEPRVEAAVARALATFASRLRVSDVELAAFVVVRLVLGVAHAAVVDRPAVAERGRLAKEVSDAIVRYLVRD